MLASLLIFWFFGLTLVYTTEGNEINVTNPDFQTTNKYEYMRDDLIRKLKRDGHRKQLKDLQLYQVHQTKEKLAKSGYNGLNMKNKHEKFFKSKSRITTTTPEVIYISTTLGLPSTRNPFTSLSKIRSTPYPCLYGICNGTCCKSDSVEALFDCANGQKINKSLVCNRVNDCNDGSDESECDPWSPKITVLPKSYVEVHCGDQDKQNSGTLVLECESVGYPTPLIRWIKYDGHVPSKCQQYSRRGHGILTCPNFEQSDQGSYSCVAENGLKLAESQPKSLARCSNIINCSGFRVRNEEQIEHCLECYCSGKTKSCQSIRSKLSINTFPFPEMRTEIFFKSDGEILFIPTKTSLRPHDEVRQSAQPVTYCLFENELKESSFLKSFGRNLIIPKYQGKINFFPKAPLLIIQGNGLSLMYTANVISTPRNSETDLSIRFWPGNWHHVNKQVADREDLMKVLSDLSALYIRCEYQEGDIISWNKNVSIFLESSFVTDFSKSVSYVEKCNCPPGYDGLSCESCAAGYTKKVVGNDFACEKIPLPSCMEGYKGNNCSDCDTTKGYYKKGSVCEKPVCHPDGALSIFPNALGKCECKETVTGNHCEKCKSDFFYLHKSNKGCLQCWCSGITNQCRSSSLYRTLISNIPRGGYNSSDGRNFWLLPSDFNGNRLSSYGGHFNYTIKYKPNIPKQNAALTVEFLSRDDVTIFYTHENLDGSTLKNEKFWSVPLIETKWRKSKQSSITRGEFLTVLSKIKAIYIESPYHLSSGQANLTSARMSSAASSGDDDTLLALEVEQCNCPLGYMGLSCETCSEGYYKKRNGNLIQCIKCNCSYCDPEFGCPDCPQLTYRDNPEKEKMPICKPCPCNGNGVSCVKDDHHQIFCRCKSGFTGMHCENSIPDDKHELTVTISPRKIYGKKIGSVVHVNCSFVSSEKMTLLAKKRYQFSKENFLKSSSPKLLLDEENKAEKTFEIVLENELEAIECLVYDTQDRLAGHVVAHVEDLITTIKPVKITTCYSDSIVLRESESKEIICEATGSPTPMLNWYRKVNDTAPQKVDSTDGVHTIKSVTLKNNGTIYSCIAENSEGDKETCTIVLIVRQKCEIITTFPKKVRVTEGKKFSIQCKTTAQSPVRWSVWDSKLKKEAEIIRLNSVVDGLLQITNATLLDSGIYICSTEGKSGKISTNVSVVVEEQRIPPIVFIKEDDKVLSLGESFVAHCTATGRPAPTIYWKKLNDTISNNVLIENNTLTIRNAMTQNSGIYGCEARSLSGNASSYISIEVEEVQYPPKVKISQAQRGDTVDITCLAKGYPRPILYWFSPRVNLTTVSSIQDTMIRSEPLLSVKETVSFTVTNDINDIIISCVAENSAGKDEMIAQVKVPQSKIGINETVELVPIGSNFVLSCEFSGNLTWEKLNHLVGDECFVPNGLLITSVQNQHNGTYICKGDSDLKKVINLIVTGYVPKFSKELNSYLILPVHLKSTNEIRIEISFNSTSENGLLLQKENSQLEIHLEKRKIHLSVYHGQKVIFNIRMNNPIELRTWYFLVMFINRNYVDITVYNEKSEIHERETEHFKSFNIPLERGSDTIFLGGSIKNTRHFRRMLPQHHFNGCISRLKIDNHEFDIVKEGSYSHNVGLCKRCAEEQSLCSGRGKCLDAPTQYGFICVCPKESESKAASCDPSCTAKGCETKLDLCALLNPCNGFSNRCQTKVYNLECQCTSSYSGTTCDNVNNYSFCARGNGYIRLPSNLIKRQLGVPEIMEIGFTLNKLDGQLLWQGDTDNYLSIAVRGGKLEYTYLNQHSKLEIVGPRELKIDEKYSLHIRRINNTVALNLNWSNQIKSESEVFRNFTSKTKTNRVTGDIYLGFVPKTVLDVNQHAGLNGCISYLTLGGKSKINFAEKQLEEFNVFFNTINIESYYEPSEDSDASYYSSEY